MRTSIKDDEIYGPIRAEICDAYIAAGKPMPERNWLYSRLIRVTLERSLTDPLVSQLVLAVPSVPSL